MNRNLESFPEVSDIQLNAARPSLQAVVVLSALVFVLNFTFEVLDSFKTTHLQLWLVSALVAALGIWSITECVLVMRQQSNPLFHNLLWILIAQLLLPIFRASLMQLDSRPLDVEWVVSYRPHDDWHLLFLLPYGVVFLGVQKTVIDLFTHNEKVRASNREKQMLITLNAMATARDNETGNHILRTQNYVQKLALRLRKMGRHQRLLTRSFIDLLYKAAPLHDIGKVGIPDHILKKRGSLSPEEWEIMKTHASIGESILSTTTSRLGRSDDVLDKAIMIAGGHHERWDGSGYPRGLKGEAIPLAARIMAVADVYDALVSKRVYKSEWSHEEAVAEIAKLSGSHLDPDVVAALIAEKDAFREIAASLQD